MKKTNIMLTVLTSLLIISFLTTSCINHLPLNETSEEQIPILVDPQIVLPVDTRMSGANFENHDAMGLFVLQQPAALNEERHLDNVRFTYSADGFVPETAVYYPYGKGLCDFYSYYPFQAGGVEAKTTLLPVSVKSDQREPSDYQASDLLVAKELGVAPGDNAVKLVYYHKMCWLKVVIDVKGEEDMATVLNSNPVVALRNLNTEGMYDFAEDTITGQQTPQEIFLNGAWSIEGRTLVGEQAILIPQTVAEGADLISLQVDGRLFSGTLSEELVLEAGKVCTLTLSYDPKVGIEGFYASITGWDITGDEATLDLVEEEIANGLSVASLDFNQTGIYDILQGDEVIAVVCREYLLSDNVDNQAIVLYTAPDDAYKLTEGTVLQLMGTSKQEHGGTVSWNTTDNSLTYVQGMTMPLPRLFVDENRTITFTQPENSLPIRARKRLLTDVRHQQTTTYPLVKIGTQYWMQADLSARYYADDSAIPLLEDAYTVTAGYRVHEQSCYYNHAAVSTNRLAPQGWEIPDASAWDALAAYVAGNSAVLKTGSSWANANHPATNLTGFSAKAVGFYGESEGGGATGIFGFANKYCGYWKRTADTPAIVVLNAESNEFHKLNATTWHGVLVRCVYKAE